MNTLKQMENNTFDPNAIGIPNGNYFGFPTTPEEAKLILLSFPWDVTTSYRTGASKGPQAIMDASMQLDFYNSRVPAAWESPIASIAPEAEIIQRNHYFRNFAKIAIDQLEKGINPKDHDLLRLTRTINRGCEYLNTMVYAHSKQYLDQGKQVGIVGGDHSVPLGLIKALAEKHNNFAVLQIDAHADLRKAYMGFKYSHASIMYNVMQLPTISHLVQVGIRDVCQEEMDRARSDHRIRQFTDEDLAVRMLRGDTWETLSTEIIAALPEKVYISFDIDGLDPSLCPNTGTPVPGGLLFNHILFLIDQLASSGKKIVGFDLCEVAPGKENTWDANVGARVLYLLALLAITNG